MNGCPHDDLHSWVVNAETGQPTDFGEDQMHPQLTVNAHVINNRAEALYGLQLLEWLGSFQE